MPEQLHLAVPHSFEELRRVRRTLELYRQNYAVHVAALMVATHIFLQVLCCPPCVALPRHAACPGRGSMGWQHALPQPSDQQHAPCWIVGPLHAPAKCDEPERVLADQVVRCVVAPMPCLRPHPHVPPLAGLHDARLHFHQCPGGQHVPADRQAAAGHARRLLLLNLLVSAWLPCCSQPS